jgi:CheY-like chemotaxis protein
MQSTADCMPTVLIADDDDALNQVWQDLLSSAGFDVLTSNTGLKALDTVRFADKVDVVLLDYKMPVLDGAQTLAHLKEQFPSVKAIGVTGVESSQLPAAYREGVQKLLVKPVKRSDLIEAIESVTGATAQTGRVKGSAYWVRFALWYALILVISAGILTLLQRATMELLASP